MPLFAAHFASPSQASASTASSPTEAGTFDADLFAELLAAAQPKPVEPGQKLVPDTVGASEEADQALTDMSSPTGIFDTATLQFFSDKAPTHPEASLTSREPGSEAEQTLTPEARSTALASSPPVFVAPDIADEMDARPSIEASSATTHVIRPLATHSLTSSEPQVGQTAIETQAPEPRSFRPEPPLALQDAITQTLGETAFEPAPSVPFAPGRSDGMVPQGLTRPAATDEILPPLPPSNPQEATKSEPPSATPPAASSQPDGLVSLQGRSLPMPVPQSGLRRDAVHEGLTLSDSEETLGLDTKTSSVTQPSTTDTPSMASASHLTSPLQVQLQAQLHASKPMAIEVLHEGDPSGSHPDAQLNRTLSQEVLPPLPTATSAQAKATFETLALLSAQMLKRLDSRTTRFDMTLTPASLGQVDVMLEIDAEGQVMARLAFDTPAAAAEMRGRADELRRQLQEAGLELAQDGLEFTERDASSQSGQQGFDRSTDRRAFAGAARLADQTDPALIPPPPAWADPSLTPDRVDLKV